MTADEDDREVDSGSEQTRLKVQSALTRHPRIQDHTTGWACLVTVEKRGCGGEGLDAKAGTSDEARQGFEHGCVIVNQHDIGPVIPVIRTPDTTREARSQPIRQRNASGRRWCRVKLQTRFVRLPLYHEVATSRDCLDQISVGAENLPQGADLKPDIALLYSC